MTELVIPTFAGDDPGRSPESLYLRYGDGGLARASDGQVELNALPLLFIGTSNDLLHSFYQGQIPNFGSLGAGDLRVQRAR